MNVKLQTWSCSPWCPTCRRTVTVEIPRGTGIAAFLESRPPCPACGQPGLQLTEDVIAPKAVGETS